jgi:Protein of unknown function (DUF3987)
MAALRNAAKRHAVVEDGNAEKPESKDANHEQQPTSSKSMKELLALKKAREAATAKTAVPKVHVPVKPFKGKGGSVFDIAAKRKQTEAFPKVQEGAGEKQHEATVETEGIPIGRAISLKKPEFPTEALNSLKDVVILTATSVQVAPAMVVGVLIAFLSAVLQAFFNVSLYPSGEGKPLSLNMFLIADSGDRKSSTIHAIAKPLYLAIQKLLDARKRMLVQDVTVDGLVVGLIERCPSQMLLVPEAATLLSSHAMSKENLMRFLGILSSLFSGEAISRTRVDEHHYAEGRRLNALIMSQAIVAMEFLGSDLVMQQGLGNRFLYDTPESQRGKRLFNEHDLDSDPEYLAYCQFIDMMVSRVMKINEATGGVSVKVIRTSPEAKAIWVDHYNALEIGCCEGGPFATHAGYVTRFPEQTLRLAGILTLVEDLDANEITADAMTRAVMLADYYLQAALHLFNKAPADNDEFQARILLHWMRERQLAQDLPAIPVRMIYKDGPRTARSVERARKLLKILEERGDVSKFEGTVRYSEGKRSGDNYSANLD